MLIDSYKFGDVFKKYHVDVSFEQEDTNKKYDFDCLKRIATNPNNKILLLWRGPIKHCVRFVSIKQNGDIEVMDPQLGKFDIYTKSRQDELNLGIIYFALKYN